MSGIIIAISNKKMKLNIPLKGLLLAFGGALGQAVGLILSKKVWAITIQLLQRKSVLCLAC